MSVYTDLTAEFDYKDLITWSNLDKLGENDNYFYDILVDGTDSQQILHHVGTAALPAYSFIGRTTDGAYSSALNNYDIATTGIRRVNVGSAGNITLYGDSAAAAANATTLAIVSGNTAITLLNLGDTDDSGIGAIRYSNSIDQMQFLVNGSVRLSIDSSGNIVFAAAGTQNVGDASFYPADISYKTLTDRGCVGCFDKGVELQDGRIVSDTEALLNIKIHPTKKTVYGVDMFDYRTFPKASYKKADRLGILLERDSEDEPIGGTDGIEMTSMFSIMIGAIRELTNRVKLLELKRKEVI